MGFKANFDKSIESTLFVLNQIPSCDIHKLFKILYFADQKHLVKFGRPITGDHYIAMQKGPVPSLTYNIVKTVRGDNEFCQLPRDVKNDIEVVSWMFVMPKRAANTDYLSESDISCLQSSIDENRNLAHDALTEKSHDSAWSNSEGYEMPVLEIAAAAGSSNEMLKYIKENMENSRIF